MFTLPKIWISNFNGKSKRLGCRAEWLPHYSFRGRCGVKDECGRSTDLKSVYRRSIWHKRGIQQHQRATALCVLFWHKSKPSLVQPLLTHHFLGPTPVSSGSIDATSRRSFTQSVHWWKTNIAHGLGRDTWPQLPSVVVHRQKLPQIHPASRIRA